MMKENAVIIIFIYIYCWKWAYYKTSACWYKFKYVTYYSIEILINQEIWDIHTELTLIPALLLEPL
jgi:hypothetical protein